MNIHFKYNGQEYNHPNDQNHIHIQSDFKQKIETLLEPIKEQIEADSTGHIDVNYVDEHIDKPFINIHGFGIDNNVKILVLLKPMVDK